MYLRFGLLLLGFYLPAVAASTFHNYELNGVPFETSDCIEVGKRLAQKFEKVTSVVPRVV